MGFGGFHIYSSRGVSKEVLCNIARCKAWWKRVFTGRSTRKISASIHETEEQVYSTFPSRVWFTCIYRVRRMTIIASWTTTASVQVFQPPMHHVLPIIYGTPDVFSISGLGLAGQIKISRDGCRHFPTSKNQFQ